MTCTAAWLIFGFRKHHQKHAVYRLSVHLPFNQSVYFRSASSDADLQQAMQRDSMLLGWFKLCAATILSPDNTDILSCRVSISGENTNGFLARRAANESSRASIWWILAIGNCSRFVFWCCMCVERPPTSICAPLTISYIPRLPRLQALCTSWRTIANGTSAWPRQFPIECRFSCACSSHSSACRLAQRWIR